jgi:hypothetical protein
LRIVITFKQTFHLSAFAALLLVTGCGGASTPAASTPVNPAQAVHKSCEQTCNGEYDACMDRFGGAGGGPNIGRHQDGGNSDLGPNEVCPDQIRSCLKRCSL